MNTYDNGFAEGRSDAFDWSDYVEYDILQSQGVRPPDPSLSFQRYYERNVQYIITRAGEIPQEFLRGYRDGYRLTINRLT